MTEPVLGGMFICRPLPLPYAGGTIQGLTLISDCHLGAPHVNYRLLERELADAKASKDRILINGDLFDGILPSDKKRFTNDVLHPRLQGRRDIVNELVEWGLEMLAPVAEQIDMIGVGNHETAIEKHHSVDVTKLLIYELEKLLPKKSAHVIHYGGYTGFVDYRFQYHAKSTGKTAPGGGMGQRFVLYYHHGSGGQAPVTKGLIDFNRKDVFVDADAIWLGHKHNRLSVAVQKIACPMGGDQPAIRDVRHVMTGAYFNTYTGQSQQSLRKHGRRSNYAADWGLAPQGQGGARLELRFERHHERYTAKVVQ